MCPPTFPATRRCEMTLSDRDIRDAINSGELLINPYDPEMVQPASYDLHLGSHFKQFRPRQGFLSVRHECEMLDRLATEDRPMVIMPGQFLLGHTEESVGISERMVGRLEGKSSLARLGLVVHEAGFFDPGFRGQCTLELFNLAPVPIQLYPGQKIVQMAFDFLSSAAERPYGTAGLGSKYQDQIGATASRAHTES